MPRPLLPRDPGEPHRAATPLELLFDLCFVVAIAQAARGLHHGLAAGHVGECVLAYAMVFFAIWWAWMQFTWFASGYDTDDFRFRLLALVQIVGVLFIAAGIPRAFESRDFLVMTVGYVITRCSLVTLWLLAARDDAAGRPTALRYALGVGVVQVGWLAILVLPPAWKTYAWLLLVPLELLVPEWAERAGGSPWHPHHIIERYGLFTLIVLGESVAAATIAIQAAIDAAALTPHQIGVIAAAPLIFFSMWWIYFEYVPRGVHREDTASTAWAYGHYVVFASAAAVGAGLSVAIEHPAGPAVAIPVALYLVAVWGVNWHARDPGLLAAAAVAVALGFSPWAEPALGLLLGAVTIRAARVCRAASEEERSAATTHPTS